MTKEQLIEVNRPGFYGGTSGRSVAEVAADLGVSDQTIYNWRNQERMARQAGFRWG
jgi:transposase